MPITNFPAYTGTALSRNLTQVQFDEAEEYFQAYQAAWAAQMNGTTIPELNALETTCTNSAATATTKAGEALSSANSAGDSSTLAGKWASEAVDVVVQSEKYSAFHWATKAYEYVATLAAGAINDSITALDATWSSSKISTLLSNASNIGYNNSISRLTATNVKTAIDELDARIDSGEDIFAPIDSPVFTGPITAKDLSYKSTPVTITSWSYSGTTITLNVSSHTFVAGDYIEVSGLTATTNIPNGVHLVTSVTATTIVFTYALTPTGTAGVSSPVVKGYATTNGRTNGIGEGQTWQDVTASRVINTTYTNTTGKPIMVSVKSYVALNNGIYSLDMYVNKVLIYQHEASIAVTAAMQLSGVIIVPPGATYKIGETGFTTWFELR